MQQTSYLPKELVEIFQERFSYPEKPLFGSVATVHNHQPRIRTMRIYEFNQEGCPILLTHTQSNKWGEFVNCPQTSINLVHESKLLQIIVSGRLVLDTLDSSTELAARYWKMVRSDVKKIYDDNHEIEKIYSEREDLSIPQEVPNNFGIVQVIPSFWEVLELNSEYTKSHRHQFYFKEGSWQKQRVHVG